MIAVYSSLTIDQDAFTSLCETATSKDENLWLPTFYSIAVTIDEDVFTSLPETTVNCCRQKRIAIKKRSGEEMEEFR